MGGANDEISFVRQQVTVPTNLPYLAYWQWIQSEDVCGYDFGGVIANNDTVVGVYDLCVAEATGGWQRHVVDLRAYQGQSISVQIRAETDSWGMSNLFVDDVSFQSSAAVDGDEPAAPGASGALPKSEALTREGAPGGSGAGEQIRLLGR